MESHARTAQMPSFSRMWSLPVLLKEKILSVFTVKKNNASLSSMWRKIIWIIYGIFIFNVKKSNIFSFPLPQKHLFSVKKKKKKKKKNCAMIIPPSLFYSSQMFFSSTEAPILYLALSPLCIHKRKIWKCFFLEIRIYEAFKNFWNGVCNCSFHM